MSKTEPPGLENMEMVSVAGLVASMEQGGLPLEKFLQVSFLSSYRTLYLPFLNSALNYISNFIFLLLVAQVLELPIFSKET